MKNLLMNLKIKRMDKNRMIKTVSGKYIDVFDADENSIIIEDIAHGLSHQCRFGGHVKEFYSVAEHCIWMAERATKENELDALLHDASEAYLLDLPKPIKNGLMEYVEVEHDLMTVISKKFNFTYPIKESVKILDKLAFEFERKNKLNDNTFPSLSPKEAKEKFLLLYYQILKRQNNLITV